MIRAVIAPAVLAGLIAGAFFGFHLGLSMTQTDPPSVAVVDSLAWEVDLLHGRTLAGMQMCHEALTARRN